MITPRLDVPVDYLLSQGLSATFPARFWAKVDVRGPDDCWLWTGSTHHGYGQINRGYFRDRPATVIPAHVASWILCCGPIPKGLIMLHKCPGKHNRMCVNPAHLKPGNKSENGKDSILQGTNSLCIRIDKFRMRLTAELAVKIRSEYTGKRGEQAALGRKYGVSRHAIRLIVHNKTW